MREVNSFIICMFLFCFIGNAQKFEKQDKIPHDISYYRKSRVSKPLVKVVYGRPQNNGEQVFGNLVAYNEIWRTGANEATEVKFYQDVLFGNKKIKAGTYVLYTIPGEDEWEIILSSNLDVLGAFQYDPVFDVAKIKVTPNRTEVLDVFSIGFKEKEDAFQMVLAWDTTRVNIPIKAAKTINQSEYAGL